MIRIILEKLQEAYTKRDISLINQHIAQGDNVLFLGTGNEELCQGYQQCCQLLESDFLYWGDVSLDLDQAIIHEIGDGGYFQLKGLVKTEFRDSKKRNLRYISFCQTICEEDDMQDSDKIALLNLALGLTYHKRKNRVRQNNWPLVLSGVIENHQITKLHFSLENEELVNIDATIKNMPEQDITSLASYHIGQYFDNPIELTQGYVHHHFLIVSGYQLKPQSLLMEKYLQEIKKTIDEDIDVDVKLLKLKQSIVYAVHNQKKIAKFPFRLTACIVENKLVNVHISSPHFYIFEDLKRSR